MTPELFPLEQIQQISGYNNYYITSFGRVWSTYFGGHWLTPTLNKRGKYKRYYVNLGRGNNNRYYLHQLVANAFVPNPNNYTEIDHIDGDSTNNYANNLRWVSHQENMQNSITMQNVSKNGGAYLEIEEIATGKTFWGYEEAAKYSGLNIETIKNHANGKYKKQKWRKTGRKKSFSSGEILDV